jgi:hypothetical protein
MNLSNLDNLIKTGQLKIEPTDPSELIGLLQAGKTRFLDEKNPELAIESRFDLAYNAAHSLALAALRRHGYRPENKYGHRYIVFQTISLTTDLDNNISRIFHQCHVKRNHAEYGGYIDIDEQLLAELLNATGRLLDQVNSFSTGDT